MRLTNRWTAIGVLLVVLGLVVAACGGDSASDTTSAALAEAPEATFAPSEEAPAADFDDEAAGERALGSSGLQPIAQQVVDLGREIIFTADLTVAVTDVAAASAEATQIIDSVGGFLFGQQATGAPQPVSVLTFKVPPERFQEALNRLGDVGEIRTQNVSADDVTERVVDLESRIDTAAASVERLKSFLSEANDIVTITELEAQLLERETDLETLRGQLRTIRDRIDLATIVVTLTEALARPELDLLVSAYPGHDDGGLSCPADGSQTVDKGERVTVCFTILNAGDTPLTDFELTDNVLDVELGDLIVVFGDPEELLQPGQSIDLAAEITVDRSVRTQTRATAIPVNQDGERLETRAVSSTTSLALTAVEPEGIAGFSDGLEAAVDILVATGRVMILAAGFLLPFLPLLLLAALAYWWWRRRRPATKPAPPPPPPTLEDAGSATAGTPQEGDAGADPGTDASGPGS